MEQSKGKQSVGAGFVALGLIFMVSGLIFGTIGAFQYIFPGLFKPVLGFDKIRPLHVSSAVFWILLGACGSVLHYIIETQGKLWSEKLARWQRFLFATAMFAILISYIMGIFGGREYWEFNPLLALPIIAAWLLFIINVFKSIKSFRHQPVYVWMWLTGAAFFLFTYIESYLWLIPSFRSGIIHDMTIQWKSYGSMVGGWNMLIYGTSIFLMDKISGSQRYSYSGIAFALYFLGLFNLMFNWGHHIYTLPGTKFIQYISYLVSMTELLLLGRIIYFWRSSVSTAMKHYHILPYRFLFAADIWIFLTLILAIAMSIPAINAYTHGTHITVGHTMGATIGINTFLLLAFAADIFDMHIAKPARTISVSLYIAAAALFVFWLSLVIAGVHKAYWQMHTPDEAYSIMMYSLRPYFVVFLIAGIILATALTVITVSLLKRYFKLVFDYLLK